MPRNTRDLTNNSNLVPALWPSIIMQSAGVMLTSPLSFFRQVIISRLSAVTVPAFISVGLFVWFLKCVMEMRKLWFTYLSQILKHDIHSYIHSESLVFVPKKAINP